jgi:hypothetical protein
MKNNWTIMCIIEQLGDLKLLQITPHLLHR